MKIKEVYERFNIPPNLQLHMLRVAALAKIISEAWTGDAINKDVLYTACLLHDLGNLLKFDLDNLPELLGAEAKNVEYWRNVKKAMQTKYGNDEHQATITMCKELGINYAVLYVINNKEFKNFDKIAASTNWELKLCAYADHRTAPFGITSLAKRLAEQKMRYRISNRDAAQLSLRSNILVEAAQKVERQIEKNVSVNIQTIADHDVEQFFDYFLTYKLN